jgi:hypothetical protein
VRNRPQNRANVNAPLSKKNTNQNERPLSFQILKKMPKVQVGYAIWSICRLFKSCLSGAAELH